ncbi:hypothetical protein BKD02_04780 [Brucella sp. 09RB8910]|nr:hypothetical protein BKD02_04780 [Brucella sp. 09RB8910]
MSLNIPNMHQETHGQKQKGQRFRCPQTADKPVDFFRRVCQQSEPGTKPGFEALPDLLDYLHFWIAASAAEMPFRE